MTIAGLVERQKQWSKHVFGTGPRTLATVRHIKFELKEIKRKPMDLEEWIDVVLLALDGCWRTGASPMEVQSALLNKQSKNRKRQWPPLNEHKINCPVEHIRKQPVDLAVDNEAERVER